MLPGSSDAVCHAAEAVASRCGLEVWCIGDKALLLRGDEIAAYLFPREELPRLGVYGYYGGHFVEVWEGGRLGEGLRVALRDPVVSCVYMGLLGLGERAVRVIRLRGKYGDPHLSLSLETRRFQLIREYIVSVGSTSLPRVKPGEYAWSSTAREPCREGVYGVLDGVWVEFSGARLGFVRGLTVYRDCRRVAGREEYEGMRAFEERELGGVLLVKIPYMVAASLVDSNEAVCCGFRVRIGYGGVEAPLWRRAGERFEVKKVNLVIEKIREK